MRKFASRGGRSGTPCPPPGGPPRSPLRLPGGPCTGQPCGTHRAQGHGRCPLQEFPSQRREAFPRGPGAARGWGVLTARRPPRPPEDASECTWGRAGLPRRHRRLTLPGTEVRPHWSPGPWGGGGVVPPERPRSWSPRDMDGSCPGSPTVQRPPEKGRRGPSAVLRAEVSSRWGPPGEAVRGP